MTHIHICNIEIEIKIFILWCSDSGMVIYVNLLTHWSLLFANERRFASWLGNLLMKSSNNQTAKNDKKDWHRDQKLRVDREQTKKWPDVSIIRIVENRNDVSKCLEIFWWAWSSYKIDYNDKNNGKKMFKKVLFITE